MLVELIIGIVLLAGVGGLIGLVLAVALVVSPKVEPKPAKVKAEPKPAKVKAVKVEAVAPKPVWRAKIR